MRRGRVVRPGGAAQGATGLRERVGLGLVEAMGDATRAGNEGLARPGAFPSRRSRPAGQWQGLVIAALLLAGCGRHKPGGAADAGARDTPSGLAVPRYVATKFETVNARAGPGDDYATVWTYHARGLPLQVIAETVDWRRVCDPDGAVAWVHRRTTAETARVMRVAPSPLPLHARPTADARVTAALAGRATAALVGCQGGWCRVTADKVSGWAPASELWGLQPTRACP